MREVDIAALTIGGGWRQQLAQYFQSIVMPGFLAKSSTVGMRAVVHAISILAIVSLSLFLLRYSGVHFADAIWKIEPHLEIDGDEWPQPEDKIIVVAKTRTEYIDWLGKTLPEYVLNHHSNICQRLNY